MGAYEDYAYDSRSRPTSVTVKNSSGSTLRSQSYAYDAASRITGHTLAGVATAYAYDDADRLISETRTGYSGSYTYDANGNRLTRTVNWVAEAYVHDAGDKLTSVTWNGGSKTFGYDAAGRTTSVATSAGTTTLAYDFESRLVSMAGPGLTASYAYNGLDSRRSKTVNGVARSYLRDGAYVTDPLLHGFALVGRSRLRMRAYRWFPLSPAPLPPGERGSRSWASVREYGVTKYLHWGLKNVDAQSSASQSITGMRVYDAFGNVESSSGTWTGAFGYGGPYGYQSAGEGGLMLLGHRYYEPSTGRFLTRDPIKDGRNWYAYGAGDSAPTLFADPDGKEWIDLIAGWGDSLSFGLTNGIRRGIGHVLGIGDPNDQIDFGHGDYARGSLIGDVHGLILRTPAAPILRNNKEKGKIIGLMKKHGLNPIHYGKVKDWIHDSKEGSDRGPDGKGSDFKDDELVFIINIIKGEVNKADDR